MQKVWEVDGAEIRVTPSPHLTRGGGCACSACPRKLLTSWDGIFNYRVVGEETAQAV